MKKYQIELTATELQKLHIFLVMKKEELMRDSEAYTQRINEVYEGNPYNYSEKAVETFKSNRKWFYETYQVIDKLSQKLDKIPF